MKKISILILVAVVLITSCAKTEEKAIEQPKKVALNDKPLNEGRKQSDEKGKISAGPDHPEESREELSILPKHRIYVDDEMFDADELPEISMLLDNQHTLTPDIKDLPNDLIWQREGVLENIVMNNGQIQIVTNTTQYKSHSCEYVYLDEIGGNKFKHSIRRGTLGSINYGDYLSFDKKNIATTNYEKTEVFDINTDKLIFECENRKLNKRSDRYFANSFVSGDKLYTGNPYEIRCVDLMTKKDNYKISFENLGAEDCFKPDNISYVSFIGIYNDSMYVFVYSKNILLLKVQSTGNCKVVYKSKLTYDPCWSDPCYLVGKNEDYFICYDEQSTAIVADIRQGKYFEINYREENQNNSVLQYQRYKGIQSSKYLLYFDVVFDLDQRKPLCRLPAYDSEQQFYLTKDSLFIKKNETLYSFDLETLITEWSYKLSNDFIIFSSFDPHQISIATGNELLFFYFDQPSKMYRINIDFSIAQYHQKRMQSSHTKTSLSKFPKIIKTFFDASTNRTYISGWESVCLGDNSTVNPLVYPTRSRWCFDREMSEKYVPESMDIFVRWNGTNAVKTSVQCNSKEKSNLKSEIMLEPGKLTRLKVWFDNKGQVLTIGDKSYNVYINPGWCPD